MSSLELITLGAAGEDYLRQALNNSGLSKELQRLLPNGGHVSAVLPQGTQYERTIQFDAGGISSCQTARAWLARRICKLVAQGAGSLVTQDVWGAQPHDAFDKSIALPKFYYADNVYTYLTAANISESKVLEAFDDVAGYQVVSALISHDIRLADILDDGNVSHELIVALATHAKEVYVYAYDQEGFVMWHR